METCWAGDIYLFPLINRFVKLSLQLISRYRTWLENGLATSDLTPTSQEPVLPPTNEPKSEKVEIKDSLFHQLGIKEWIFVAYDLDKLTTHIPAHFFEYVKPKLQHISEEISKSVKGVYFLFFKKILINAFLK